MLPNCELFRVELSDEVKDVIAALRVLERPIESSEDELRHALKTLGDAAKIRSEWYLPFEVNIAIETAQRAWAAIYATWRAKDDEKAIVLMHALEASQVWCSKLNELHRAIVHEWDPFGDPPAVAIEALRCWDDGETILCRSYRMTPEAAAIWFRKCPDASILKKLSGYLLKWCKCRTLRHRRWIWAFHNKNAFTELLQHAPFVEAWVDAAPRMYPHLSEKGLAVRIAIVRKVAANPRIEMTNEQRAEAFALFKRLEYRSAIKSCHPIGKRDDMTKRDREILGWRAK